MNNQIIIPQEVPNSKDLNSLYEQLKNEYSKIGGAPILNTGTPPIIL